MAFHKKTWWEAFLQARGGGGGGGGGSRARARAFGFSVGKKKNRSVVASMIWLTMVLHFYHSHLVSHDACVRACVDLQSPCEDGTLRYDE